MSRWIGIVGIIALGSVAAVIAQPPGGAGGEQSGPPGGPAGQRRPDNDDHGRPVDRIAKELGVTPEKFREVFKKIKPAPRGEMPTEAQRQANRKILAEGLGVSPQKLDEVMDKYRPEGPNGGNRGPGGRAPEGGPQGGGQEGRRRPQGQSQSAAPPPHNSERFVEHAMEFDTDKDGKLDRAELMKFADDMGRRRNELDAQGPDRGGPDGADSPNNDSDRPKRPRRSE